MKIQHDYLMFSQKKKKGIEDFERNIKMDIRCPQ